jgi:predicted metalloendopeptidase
MTRVQRRDPKNVYHRMTVQELQALSPAFPWNAYFAAYGLNNLQSLNVGAPDFVKTMDSVLTAEDLAAWQAYLRWHLVHAQARWLSSQFVDEDFNFYGRTMTGQQELQPRWKRCVRYTDRALGEALGQAYVEIGWSTKSAIPTSGVITRHSMLSAETRWEMASAPMNSSSNANSTRLVSRSIEASGT